MSFCWVDFKDFNENEFKIRIFLKTTVYIKCSCSISFEKVYTVWLTKTRIRSWRWLDSDSLSHWVRPRSKIRRLATTAALGGPMQHRCSADLVGSRDLLPPVPDSRKNVWMVTLFAVIPLEGRNRSQGSELRPIPLSWPQSHQRWRRRLRPRHNPMYSLNGRREPSASRSQLHLLRS